MKKKKDKNFIEQIENAVNKSNNNKEREDYEEVKQLISWLNDAMNEKEQRDKHRSSKYF